MTLDFLLGVTSSAFHPFLCYYRFQDLVLWTVPLCVASEFHEPRGCFPQYSSFYRFSIVYLRPTQSFSFLNLENILGVLWETRGGWFQMLKKKNRFPRLRFEVKIDNQYANSAYDATTRTRTSNWIINLSLFQAATGNGCHSYSLS